MKEVRYRFPGSWRSSHWLRYGAIGRREAEYLMLYRLFRTEPARYRGYRVDLQFFAR